MKQHTAHPCDLAKAAARPASLAATAATTTFDSRRAGQMRAYVATFDAPRMPIRSALGSFMNFACPRPPRKASSRWRGPGALLLFRDSISCKILVSFPIIVACMPRLYPNCEEGSCIAWHSCMSVQGSLLFALSGSNANLSCSFLLRNALPLSRRKIYTRLQLPCISP